jgi:3-oxoacyl-[acyl-carrier protein] reductase
MLKRQYEGTAGGPNRETEWERRLGANHGGDPFALLEIGSSASIRKTISREDVEAFAALSGDFNGLHVDEEFAARTEFEQIVVHGLLHASMLSGLFGTKLPGSGALCLSHAFDFTKPVFIGDTVEAVGTVLAMDPVTRVIDVKTEIINQNGEQVLDGKAKVKVLRLAPQAAAKQAQRFKPMANLLTGQVALITGASRGIGRAIADTLAAHGATVWINYNRSKGAAESLAGEIKKQGGSVFVIKGDVTKDDEVAAMIETVARGGGIDILVNNAGPKIHSASFEELSWADMQTALEQIIGGVFRVTHAALPHLREKHGKIVNVLAAAVLGRTAYNWLPYITAKGALLSFSKNLAQELGPSGVRVNMVSPSLVDTDLVSNIPEKVRQMTVGRTPLRRLATAEDVAGAVLFFASPYADFVTGDNMLVTGGEVML